MSVVLAMEEIGPCRRQLRIEVPQPAVEAETARVTGEYGRRARIPGFRKGKVPGELVRRHYGKEIEREVIERLLPRYWRQAAAEKSIAVIRACGTVLRTRRRKHMRGNARSSAKRVTPVTLARPSTRRNAVPIRWRGSRPGFSPGSRRSLRRGSDIGAVSLPRLPRGGALLCVREPA